MSACEAAIENETMCLMLLEKEADANAINKVTYIVVLGNLIFLLGMIICQCPSVAIFCSTLSYHFNGYLVYNLP